MPISTDFQFINHDCPNMAIGRDGMTVRAIVLHKPEGNLPEVLDYLMNPDVKKSYHYLIAKNGEVHKLVDEVNTAWHAGVVIAPSWTGLLAGVNPNLYTIGIACEGFAAEEYTDQQKMMLTLVVAQLQKRMGIPNNETTLVYHHEIRNDKACPGTLFDKKDLGVAVQGYLDGSGAMPSAETLKNFSIGCE